VQGKKPSVFQKELTVREKQFILRLPKAVVKGQILKKSNEINTQRCGLIIP